MSSPLLAAFCGEKQNSMELMRTSTPQAPANGGLAAKPGPDPTHQNVRRANLFTLA